MVADRTYSLSLLASPGRTSLLYFAAAVPAVDLARQKRFELLIMWALRWLVHAVGNRKERSTVVLLLMAPQ